MSVAERVDLIDQLNADVESIANTGIRATQPDLTATVATALQAMALAAARLAESEAH